MFPYRYVLTIKHAVDACVRYKARFVLGGHRDREKDFAVHKTVNLKQPSLRMILALATILSLDVWSQAVKKAYLQSGADLQRKIFIRPNDMNLSRNELIQIVKPLYGLTESGDFLCETFVKFH